MSYIVVLLLVTVGYVIGAPIATESLKFRIVDCTSNENDTLSKYVLEVTNVNETCVRVNVSSATENEMYLYVVPASETGVQIHIATENCSVPLPNIHLSLCDNELDLNHTETMVTYRFSNISLIDAVENNDNSTLQPFDYTGPTVYETLHHLDLNDDEEDNTNTTTTVSQVNIKENKQLNDTTSEESEEKRDNDEY